MDKNPAPLDAPETQDMNGRDIHPKKHLFRSSLFIKLRVNMVFTRIFVGEISGKSFTTWSAFRIANLSRSAKGEGRKLNLILVGV